MERDILSGLQPPIEEEQHATGDINNNGEYFRTDDECLASFRSMLEIEWYWNNMSTHNEQVAPNFEIQTQQHNYFVSPSDPNSSIVMQPLGSSSFSPPSNFSFSHLLNTENNINNIISTTTNKINEENNSNPSGSVFGLESHSGCLTPFQGNQTDLSAQTGRLSKLSETSGVGFESISLQEERSFGGGSGSLSSMFLSNDKVFGLVETPSLVFTPPDLLNNKDMSSNMSEEDKLGTLSIPHFTSTWLKEIDQNTEKEVSGEVNGGLNLKSKEGVDICGIDDGNDDEDENVVGEVDRKGKKKQNLSKNLLAEKRRRKKLSDKMYTLRSAVPIISKMDKASILGDAVEYLNELRQKANDLQTELISLGSSLALTTSFPRNQSTEVEAWETKDGTVNIHMFCAYKPGVLFSIMNAFDILGLKIHQATISCFNGFTIDVYKAEHCMQGQKVNVELIKVALVNAVDYHE